MSSYITCVCKQDQGLTITEGLQEVAAFLGCPLATIESVYKNSLRLLCTQSESSIFPQPHRVQIYGIPCICSARQEGKLWHVTLERLPFGLVDQEQVVGLFRLTEQGKILWADDTFRKLVGLPLDLEFDEEGYDLSQIDISFSFLFEEKYRYIAHLNLLFCTTKSAGYCFLLPHTAALYSYQKALSTNAMRVWQYDLESHRLSGVHFNDTDLFQLERLHRRLRNGEDSISERLFLEGEKRYVSVHYQREGNLAFAIEQDISSYANKQRFVFIEEHLHDRTKSSLRSIIKADLTDNKVTYLKHGSTPSSSPKALGFSEAFTSILGRVAFHEDRQQFQQRFNLEALLKAHQRGEEELSYEYRVSDEDGSIIWLEARVLLNRDLNTHHIQLLGITRVITQKKRLELSLANKPQRDKITGFYSLKTFGEIIDLALKRERDGGAAYALATIEIQGISLINSTLFAHIAQIIRLGINERCIVGRLDSTHFGLFFERAENITQVRACLERLANILANASVFDAIEQHPSAYIGFVSGLYGDSLSFSTLAERANLALLKAYERGKNQVSAYGFEDEDGFSQLLPLELLEGHAQGIVLGFMDATLRADDIGSTLPMILSQIGLYYKAKRVCLLTQEEHEDLQMGVLWEPTASARSFPPFAEDPFVALLGDHQMKRVQPEDNDFTIPFVGEHGLLIGELKVWNLKKAYLIVVGPENEDSSVFTHAVQLISSEMTKRRLLDRQEYLVYHDSDTGFGNLHGFNLYLTTNEEDSISSLGLVLLAVNDLKEITKYHGKEYATSIIHTVSETMKELLPDTQLYRLSDHEFLTVRKDITYRAFSAQVESLSEKLENLLPRMITFAQAWSEHEKNVSVLHNQARMELEANQHNTRGYSNLSKHYQAYEELHESIRRGEYIMYLQPKVCCHSMKVCSAEALIRHIHPIHGIVSPAKFIPQLEQDGLIKYIDLFAFEEVCRVLRRWKKEGHALMPISLNFSRLTLLDEKLIPTMRAICERYEIRHSLLEIEITESFGALDRNLVQKIVEDIAKAGFIVCIDDFGSDYSNLSTLTTLPLKILKLDKSLIDSLSYSEKARVLVAGFITICRNLEIATVAEGVETEVQMNLLVEMGCHLLQGYYFDKPLAVETFEQKYIQGAGSHEIPYS